MAGDGLDRVEAVLGAVAKITSGNEGNALLDARCPKCNGSNFSDLPDLYTDAVARIEDHPEQADVVRAGGMTNAQIVAKFKPPVQKSAAIPVIAVAVPLGGVAFFVYQRFGETPGQFAVIGAGVLTIATLLTRLRAVSDDYYARRREWRSRYMCLDCGQLVSG